MCRDFLGGGAGGGFDADGAGEEDVAFEMDVMAEIFVELAEAVVEGAVAGAGVGGRGEVLGELAELVEQGGGFVVLGGDDGEGSGKEAAATGGRVFAGVVGSVDGAFEGDDVGEDEGFFFGEVLVEVELEEGECGVDGGELGVGAAVAGRDFCGELEEAGEFAADVGVVMGEDVGAEELEGGMGPVGGGERGVASGGGEGEEDGGEVEMFLGADVGERLVAATAVVDAEVLEDAGVGGMLEGDLADGLGAGRVCGLGTGLRYGRGCGRHGEDSLILTLESLRGRRCDLNHMNEDFFVGGIFGGSGRAG